ncbi:MAG: Aminopeptidase Y (Arg, Lys, Leu preference) [uncultured Nocardioidaceae bacterium]|uniref:Aminopeptidase Y (Arg, Lys, Leu preference) n=1 Tax=uncultured Nocardioidaceae bacterium TaxID=253824 RepID=A0A6J4LJD8_9ACTN|nr:MAG: Aminopeptidase Y (Arg, Lys, Leu preference) [uncultured Nocardioidaceae bacterium]
MLKVSRATRAFGAGAVAALLTLVGLTAPSDAAVGPSPRGSAEVRRLAGTGDPTGLAEAAAHELLGDRPPALHPGPFDGYHQQPSIATPEGLVYVPYLRSYRGVRVVGGDFVVVADTDGTILGTSVAQRRPVRLPTTRPALSRSRAAAVARQQLGARTGETTASELVVLQQGGSHLTYESTVSTDAGPRLRVYVDASSGEVLRRDDLVVHGTGRPGYSGPSPVALDTSKLLTGFSLRDPSHPGLACGVQGGATVLTGSDDAWGNGAATNKETGCVDALFAAQEQQRMLLAWFGRPGVKATGGSYPIKVGLDAVDAYFDYNKVNLGHNEAGDWLGSIDVVAHELGHGVDHNTPGGISWAGTTEFVADAFATMTEFYSDQGARYDPPDYVIGEEVDIFGDGPVRYMYRPSLAGDPNCFSASVPNMEMHAASGPGNHWFFLAAEGSTGATGQPASPTCNRAEVSGIGIIKVSKILYHAMLTKTSAASYPKYRLWTITAAKRLYPGSCRPLKAVRAAWNAVSVPRQPGEPLC